MGGMRSSSGAESAGPLSKILTNSAARCCSSRFRLPPTRATAARTLAASSGNLVASFASAVAVICFTGPGVCGSFSTLSSKPATSQRHHQTGLPLEPLIRHHCVAVLSQHPRRHRGELEVRALVARRAVEGAPGVSCR